MEFHAEAHVAIARILEFTKILEKLATKGVCKKSGLASEALTRVKEQLEQNGPFLQIPYNNCVILVYSSFFYLENCRRYEPKCKKMDRDKMNRLSIFICEDGISFNPKTLS